MDGKQIVCARACVCVLTSLEFKGREQITVTEVSSLGSFRVNAIQLILNSTYRVLFLIYNTTDRLKEV